MASRTPSHAEAEPDGGEVEVPPLPKPLPTEKLQLRVRILGVKGLSEGDGPISVVYDYDANEFAAPPDEGEAEPVRIAGEAEAPDEASVPEQTMDFIKEHEVAPVGHQKHDALLLDLITKPVKFTVTGTVGEGDFKGVFDVDIHQLLWRVHPCPDEDDDKKRDYPFILGDFDVKKVAGEGNEGEEGAPPMLEDSPLKVTVCIELSDFAMTVEQGEESNVMTITIQELHNLPKAWSLEEGDVGGEEHVFAYLASYSIPSSNGMVEVEAEPGKMVPETPPTQPPEEVEEAPAAGEEGGGGEEGGAEAVEGTVDRPKTPPADEPEIEVLQQTLREVDVRNEKKNQRVVWGHSYSSFMTPEILSNFADALRKGAKFAVDLARKYKEADKDYVYASKYHGKSEMDLAQILEEDRQSVTVRSPVGPAIRVVAPLTEEEAPDAPDTEKDQVLHDQNITAPYLLYETYIIVTLATMRPIVKKPPPPKPVLESVAEVLPARPAVPAYKPETGGEEAYKAELRNIIMDMTEAYMRLEAENKVSESTDPLALKQAQKEMLIHLTSKSVGKWHDFKLKLKMAVVKVVNERFHKVSFGGVQIEPADEIAKLNTFLRDEMNEALARAFAAKKSFKDEPSLQVLETLLNDELRLAVESEMHMDFNNACLHLAKRIIADPKTASWWFDLGCVTCRSGDDAKAEECFHKALGIDIRHVNANLALGTLMCKRDNYREAEKYFRQASDGSSDVLAWSCCIVFFDLESKEQERKACSKQLSMSEKKMGSTKKSAYLRAGSFFVELHATQLVERAMTQEFMRNPGGQTYGDETYDSWAKTPNSTEELKVLLGKAYLHNKQFSKARMHLDDAMARAKDNKSGVVLSLKGHTHYMEQKWYAYRCDREIPKSSGFPTPYETSITLNGSIDDFYTKAMQQKPPYIDVEQYYRLSRVLIGSRSPKFPAAQRELIKACRLQPSATTWLGLAVAYYHDKMYVEAEHACSEALILDNDNGEVWGLTAVVALRQILELPSASVAPPGVQLDDGRIVDMAFLPKLTEVCLPKAHSLSCESQSR